MRRLVLMASLAALAPPAMARADRQDITVSTGFNETSLTSEVNRSTAADAFLSRGRSLYLGSVDNHGLASLGLGRIVSNPDADYHIERYPVLTVFGKPHGATGIALTLHQDWYLRGQPSRVPNRYLTVFKTEGGVVWQNGVMPKVRVTHQFETSQRRFPGRSQGVEWVWEFRRDFPTTVSGVADHDGVTEMARRSMRYENWAFFSRECGPGIVRLNLGATHRTKFRQPREVEPGADPFTQILHRSGSGQTRVPVLMVRVAYTIRRW